MPGRSVGQRIGCPSYADGQTRRFISVVTNAASVHSETAAPHATRRPLGIYQSKQPFVIIPSVVVTNSDRRRSPNSLYVQHVFDAPLPSARNDATPFYWQPK